MTQLRKPLELTSEYIEMSFMSEVYGVSQAKFHTELREIEPQFDDKSDKDVEILLDENYINHIFAYLYSSEKEYGLRQILLDRFFTYKGPMSGL